MGRRDATAIEKYDVNVIGITLSRNHVRTARPSSPGFRQSSNVEVRPQGWEEFDEKVDRIDAIGAFEAFKKERYPAFFERAYHMMPDDGRVLSHSIFTHPWTYWHEHGIPVTMRDLRFMRFIAEEIFPGGQPPSQEEIIDYSRATGFAVGQIQLLRRHYARTLDMWAAIVQANRKRAIAIQSEQVYDRYMRYLTGRADFFRRGITNVGQFTLTK